MENELSVAKLIDQMCISDQCPTKDACRKHKHHDRCKEYCQK